MDDGKHNKRLLPPNNIIQTLMKVSQFHSSSSSLSSEPNYSSRFNNQDISYQKLSNRNSKKVPRVTDKKLIAVRRKLHEKLLQLEWNNYIQWRILLAFSLGLWVLLCITDKILLRSPASAKEEKATKIPKAVDLNSANENKFSRWFSAFYSKICRAADLISNSTEAYTFAVFIFIFICLETKLRKKEKNTRENWTQYCDDSKLNLDNFEENKLAIELFGEECRDLGRNFQILLNDRNNFSNLKLQQLIIDSDLCWELKMPPNISEITCIKNTQENYFNQLEVKEVDKKIYSLNKLNKKNISYCDNKSFVETYDLEVSKFINQTATSDKSTDTQLDRSHRIKFKKSVAKKSILKLKSHNSSSRSSVNKIKNSLTKKFISSSPAFKKFLLKLNDTNPLDSVLNL